MDPRLVAFQAAYAALEDALRVAPEAQIPLLAAVDQLYEAMDEAGDALEDRAVLDAQILLRHAESLLTRYFGM